MFVTVVQIAASRKIRRTRKLPQRGKVLVCQGQVVSAMAVVAEAGCAEKHAILDVAAALNLPIEQAMHCLTRACGERVSRGDVLAKRKGMIERLVCAPQDGVIVKAEAGRLIMTCTQQPLYLRAGMPGLITEILPERGVVIENQGALVQGMYGSGGIAEGDLRLLVETIDDFQQDGQITEADKGKILVMGRQVSAQMLYSAARMGVAGVLCPALDVNCISMLQAVNLPCVALGGFGNLPYDQVSLALLKLLNGKKACLNAQAYDLINNERPELLVLQADKAMQWVDIRPRALLAAGQLVRVLAAPHRTETGTVVRMIGTLQFGNGLNLPACEIRQASGKILTVPVQDVEVIL